MFAQLWDWLWASPHPLKMYPEEVKSIRQSYERTIRLRLPDPQEGEASAARTCFFLKKFNGTRELYEADTETGEIRRLAFLAYWRGESEHYDLEIIPR